MKAENAVKFIKTVMTLTIATSPTWKTEHRRYIAERLKLLATLEVLRPSHVAEEGTQVVRVCQQGHRGLGDHHGGGGPSRSAHVRIEPVA